MEESLMQVKCADCGCLPEECIESKSPQIAQIVVGMNVVAGIQ